MVFLTLVTESLGFEGNVQNVLNKYYGRKQRSTLLSLFLNKRSLACLEWEKRKKVSRVDVLGPCVCFLGGASEQ